MGRDRTTKYDNYLTVSFPPLVMDFINQHSYETGISKQEFIRLAVRSMLTEKFGKDVEKVIIERLREKQSIKTI